MESEKYNWNTIMSLFLWNQCHKFLKSGNFPIAEENGESILSLISGGTSFLKSNWRISI